MNGGLPATHPDATHADTISARALSRLHAEGALRGIDVDFAALLRDRLRAPATVALAGALAMRAVALGHSSFALNDADRLLDALGTSAQLPDVDDWAAALVASACVAHAENAGDAGALLAFAHGRIALRRYARYEQALAESLHRCARIVTSDDDAAVLSSALRRLFPRDGAAAHGDIDRQALAAAMALRRRLLLITGGPGTGKTTTVARLLALQWMAARSRGAPPPRIALAAPTGRAAARLGEAIDGVIRADLAAGRLDADIADAIPRQARTLHRLLGTQPGRVSFRHDARHPLPFDLVVVDEASMVDLPLMAKLVAAVPETATLVLLGDPDQLPAVEAGDVLGGLCAASGDGLALPPADAQAVSVWLDTPVPARDDAPDDGAPLAGARVHLLRGWRQSDAATLQALADALQRDDRDAVMARLRDGGDSLAWHRGDATPLAEVVRREALPAFEAVRDADDPAQALQRASSLRLLTALRRGPFGAEHWNAWCAAELGARVPYFHGRLIAIGANSERHGLYNGDLGVVWRDAQGDAAVWFDTAQGLRAWRPAQLPMHASAYASTVHKAQGSEFDRVLLVLPDADARVLSRELLYTALTRARRRVVLWAAPEALERALERRTWRDSGLDARLRALSPASAGRSGS
ncbi:exodeoxyribonuclease V subunit alpha [Lysobacter hankyongensis]|uniref:RecBCD enzyme subunit RecD n=1 Tax=Lysobacter hankyongensis TaxID=1176535 RepID=A0ABP9C5E3_9GAMM